MNKAALNNEARNVFAQKIATYLIEMQKHWAFWMHRQSERLSLQMKKVVTVILVFSAITGCIFLTIKDPPKTHPTFPQPQDGVGYPFHSDSLQLMEHIYDNLKH